MKAITDIKKLEREMKDQMIFVFSQRRERAAFDPIRTPQLWAEGRMQLKAEHDVLERWRDRLPTLAGLMERYAIIAWLGAALLGKVAAEHGVDAGRHDRAVGIEDDHRTHAWNRVAQHLEA